MVNMCVCFLNNTILKACNDSLLYNRSIITYFSCIEFVYESHLNVFQQLCPNVKNMSIIVFMNHCIAVFTYFPYFSLFMSSFCLMSDTRSHKNSPGYLLSTLEAY